jgi:hypothetical protein
VENPRVVFEVMMVDFATAASQNDKNGVLHNSTNVPYDVLFLNSSTW